MGLIIIGPLQLGRRARARSLDDPDHPRAMQPISGSQTRARSSLQKVRSPLDLCEVGRPARRPE